MKLMFFGIMLNIIGVIISYYSVIDSTESEQAATIFMMIMVCFWLLSALGGCLVIMDKSSRLGTTLAIIGSAIFVPLGMVAIIGAIKLKNSQGADLSERRKRLFEEKKYG